jgi:hypothetical protein
MAKRGGRRHDVFMVARPIDLDHARRARRLIAILVDRFGVTHFLEGRGPGRVSARACDDAVALACAWIERRSGRVVGPFIEEMMRRDLNRLLRQRIAEGAACLKK